MSGMPSGAKQPKTKPAESDIEVTVLATFGGVMLAQVGNMPLLGYSLAAIGGLITMLEFKRLLNPYKALFENMNLEAGKQVPRYLGKRKTKYGYCLTFSLPYGMSTSDFEKNKLAIEQYLNNKVEIAYNNYRVFIKVFEKGLEKSPPFRLAETSKVLEFPIGIKYGGEVIRLDLEKAIHLLIAGETNSGKSTLLRGIITSLILSKFNVSLHLIDLKNGAEFNVFKKCKKVKSFSRDKKEANEILSKMINEVDRRYNLFYENDVVDIKEYNKLKNVRKLDYHVIVVDEFADLQDEKDSISLVEVLAAKARAAGIDLIISTQRPDAQIINGRIKANIPCIIGLKTMNRVNSQIIIDEPGLEELRGYGHGLLKFGGYTEFQSFYLTNEQARDLVRHTYIEKKPPIKKKEEPAEIKDFGFLEVLVGGKK